MKNNKIITNILDIIQRNKKLVAIIGAVAVLFLIVIVCLALTSGDKNVTADTTTTSVDKSTETKSTQTTTIQETTTVLVDETDANDNGFETLPAESGEEPTYDSISPSDWNMSNPYIIKVNRALNCVTVYAKDDNGEYTVPYKAMACSTGKNIEDTPLGTFKTSNKYTWRLMVDGTYSQYAYRINGPILFHAVPCFTQSKSNIETLEFNKLGSPASLGCVRLSVLDAKWLIENCPSGTTVTIYDDYSSPGPLGKPDSIKIPENSPYASWDPTDPDPANPWLQCSPKVNGPSTITINQGTSYNLMTGISATDTCGNDITQKVQISGSYDANKAGTYQIKYDVTDALGRYAELNTVITVNSIQQTTATTAATQAATTIPETTTVVTETTTTPTETSTSTETTTIPEKEIVE